MARVIIRHSGTFYQELARLYHTFTTPLILHTLLLFGGFIIPATAQTPVDVFGMAYATAGEKTLYVQGGIRSAVSDRLDQFFALDLTQPIWSTSNPPWKALNPGPPTYYSVMAVSKDHQRLFLFKNMDVFVYHFANSSWSPFTRLIGANVYRISPATDPTSGLIYFPGVMDTFGMMVFNPDTGAIKELPMPTELVIHVSRDYGAVWCKQRSSVLLYGGGLRLVYGTRVVQAPLLEYNPVTSAWKHLNTTEVSMQYRDTPCMISGSYDLDNKELGVIVYNMRRNEWTTRFSLSTSSPDTPASTSSPISGTATVPTNSARGIVIGGAVTAVVVVLVTGFLVYKCHRSSKVRQRDKEAHLSIKLESGPDSKQAPPIHALHEEIASQAPQAYIAINARSRSPEIIVRSPQTLVSREVDDGHSVDADTVVLQALRNPQEPLALLSHVPSSPLPPLPRQPQEQLSMLVSDSVHGSNSESRQDDKPCTNEEQAQLEEQVAQIKAQLEILEHRLNGTSRKRGD
ncbi:hypothetical protein BKA57DRAFT_532631 [Linnemannia elongata]|nr:hypothetical protein BKA57DRAFT_532631 [Linnemannia elongata]